MQSPDLRAALGRFPTGVAVIATCAADGRPAGLTVNSIAPVALAPARLLWSLGKRSRLRAAFEAAAGFTVNVLGEDQEDLARQMSSPAEDRFAGVAWRETRAGLPLLQGCVATFECSTGSVAEIGDHLVFIGDIVAYESAGGAPLLYLSGRYSRLERAAA